MTRVPDSELVGLLLTQRLVDTDAAPLKASEFWALVDTVSDLGSLLGLEPGEISQTTGVETTMAARIRVLLAAATGFAFALDEYQQSGLRLLSGVSEPFPTVLKERLGSAAPPLLYVLGDVGLFGRKALGIVGSRTVSASGSEIARQAAAAAAADGLGVISGGAKGTDRLAMTAALDRGGQVVGVVADSLLRTSRDPETRSAISDGQLCLCSPYKPTAGFTVGNAMGRNKLIYALSSATLVVECEEGSGGTWSGAVEALRGRIAPVIAWTGPGSSPGNRALTRLGASPLELVEDLLPLPTLDALVAPAQLSLGF
jgi:predicted Rossmann fold nucleotide-binding protein DprA/Smf involved in DNA uptake